MRTVVQISYTLDGKAESLLLDTISKYSISESSNTTSSPLITGDTIIDHVYSAPTNINISGTYALHSNTLTTVKKTSSSKLESFELLLERLKKEAVLCSIVKFMQENESSTRFVKRNNMIVTDISFDEGNDSVDYRLDFKEVQMATVKTATVSKTVSSLPETEEPTPTVATQTTVAYDYILASLVNIVLNTEDIFWDKGLTYKDFEKTVRGMSAEDFIEKGLDEYTANKLVKALSYDLSGNISKKSVIGSVILSTISKYLQSSKITFITDSYLATFLNLAYSLGKVAINEIATAFSIKYQIKRLGAFTRTISKLLDNFKSATSAYSVSSTNNTECVILVGDKYVRLETANKRLSVLDLVENAALSKLHPLASFPSDLLSCTSAVYTNGKYNLYCVYQNNELVVFVTTASPKELSNSINQTIESLIVGDLE